MTERTTRPPRAPWSPRANDITADGVDGWDRRAEALLDELAIDEPDA